LPQTLLVELTAFHADPLGVFKGPSSKGRGGWRIRERPGNRHGKEEEGKGRGVDGSTEFNLTSYLLPLISYLFGLT